MQNLSDMLNDKNDHLGQGAAALGLYEDIIGKWEEQGYNVLGFSVRMPASEGDEYLLVVRVEKDGERWVSFRSAETILSLWVSFVRALRYKNLKMKVDTYEYGDS